MTITNPRDLPKIDEFLGDECFAEAIETFGYTPTIETARAVIDEARTTLLNQGERSATCHPSTEETPLTCELLAQRVLERLAHEAKPGIRPVINATGVILHTNLGRAPFSKKVADAVYEVASTYSSLEYDFEQKSRGHRNTHVEKLLCELLGVEAAIVVNNNAAGVMLVLSTLARDREVIVSRGELVEIGGSFRIPEIMEESRAVLRGVGTTNRTHLHDYERELTDDTAALLRVHTSNFRLIGFTKSVSTKELADLAHKHDLPLIYDLGSGCLSSQLADLLTDEPTVASAIEDDADVICFSGDKLLGGPQAGIIVGKERYISPMRAHPLLRAFRCDKMALAALEHTLRLYFDDEMARRHIPILSMALVEPEELKRRTELFADKLKTHGIQATVEPSSMVMGGGTAPELYLDSWACVIDPALHEGALSPSVIDANLRASSRPVICRLIQDRLFFDLRTVRCDEEDLLIDNLMHAMKTECQS